MRLTQETWLRYFCLFGSPSFSFSATKLPGFRDWLSDAFPRLTGLAGPLCGAPDFPSGSDDASRLQLYSLLFCLQPFALAHNIPRHGTNLTALWPPVHTSDILSCNIGMRGNTPADGAYVLSYKN